MLGLFCFSKEGKTTSLLSRITGIGLNPFGKTKVKIDPLKALGTLATAGSFGALGPVAGALESIPGVGALAGLAGKVGGMIPAPILNAGKGIWNAVEGKAGATGADGSGAGGSGGIDWGNLLKYGLGTAAGVSGYNTANAQSKQATDLTNRSLNIADRLASQGAAMGARTAPLADASTAGLIARLKQGARPAVDYNRFNDPSNPFTRNFAPATATVAAAPAPVASAPVIPPPPTGSPNLPPPRRPKLLMAGASGYAR